MADHGQPWLPMHYKTPHVLCVVRELYGFPQQTLAELVGYSLRTIKAVESGKLTPSAELAHRVYIVTGLDPQQLMQNRSPDKPRDPCNRLLCPETVALRRPAIGPPDEQAMKHVDDSLRVYTAVLETMLDASVPQRKLLALRPALEAAIMELITEFGLQKDFKQLLAARYGVSGPWRGGLYAIMNSRLLGNIRNKARTRRWKFYRG